MNSAANYCKMILMSHGEHLNYRVIGGNAPTFKDARVILIADLRHPDMYARLQQVLVASKISASYQSTIMDEGWPANQPMPREESLRRGFPALQAKISGWDDIEAFNISSERLNEAITCKRRSTQIMESITSADIHSEDVATMLAQIQQIQEAMELAERSHELIQPVGGELLVRRNVSLVTAVEETDREEPDSSKIVVIAGQSHLVGDTGVIDELSQRFSIIVVEPLHPEGDLTVDEAVELLYENRIANTQNGDN